MLLALASLCLAFGSTTKTNPVDGATMVWVPAGEFVMGNNPADIDRMWKRLGWNESWKQHTKSEQPAHRVKLDGFWMYRDNVTVAQYRKFCEATRRAMPETPVWGWVDSHPVVNVSWEDAKAYGVWAKARLPYEAEWEYAAQSGSRTTFTWGDAYPVREQVANLADESFKSNRFYHPNFRLFGGYRDGYTHTSPVSAFPANRFGLRDMAGNVWQWCEDWMDQDYYSKSPLENPKGSSQGTRRVLRGGAFDTPPEMTRIARRISNLPNVRQDEKGFRCVVPR